MRRYTPAEIEPKWQNKWSEDALYEATEDSQKTKIYATPMLPYPSGAGLHTGHVRNYSITDAVARFYRQNGHNVLSAIGWDSFGLPAENYAIKTGTPPAESTAKNAAYFKKQLQTLGMSYDWSREVNTSDPDYYRWTQWVFGLMYQRKLAYKAEKAQWWCDKCNTVLADEQVVSGKCWRHEGADDPEVTKRLVSQWFFKITDYADEILEATDDLAWPDKIKTMQKNWIGRSVGAEIEFEIAKSGKQKAKSKITVFTTRPDTLFGATFLVLAPEHPLVAQITDETQRQAVDEYVLASSKKDEIERQSSKEKTGVFTGAYAINPINDEHIPIWIADYVLMGYGTGAIMAVPAHDERDHEFAKKFELPIVSVIAQDFGVPLENAVETKGSVVIVYDQKTKKYLGVKTKTNDGLWLNGGGSEANESFRDTAIRELREETGFSKYERIEELGEPVYSYYFNDVKQIAKRSYGQGFLFYVDSSKQGEPAREEHEQDFEMGWYSYEQLVAGVKEVGGGVEHWLVMLEYAKNIVEGRPIEIFHGDGILVNSGQFDGTNSAEARDLIIQHLEREGKGRAKTTYKIRDWLISRQRYWGAPVPIIYCLDHGAVLVPEKDLPVVLPEVKDYVPDGKNSSVLAGVEDWVNTVCPECGKPATRETDVMDGYVCSTWYLHRYTDPRSTEAAFDPAKANYWFPVDFYFGGDHAVAHLLYVRFFQKVLRDAGLAVADEPVKRLVYNGYINAEDGRKMSKSLGNTVDPMEIIESGYGADALRVFELFIAPYDQDTSWNTNGVPGAYRFLNRVWTLTQEYLESASSDRPADLALLKSAHKTVKKVTDDLRELSFNTAVAAMMEMTNDLYRLKAERPIVQSDDWRYAIESLIQLLAPFAPHITEELWHQLGHDDSIHVDHWPSWDEQYLVEDMIKLAVQVNGKVRVEIEVARDEQQDVIETTALNNQRIKDFLGDKKPTKVIYVPGRLVNIVIK